MFVCICLYYSWCSLCVVRCGVEKSLPITNKTVLAAHINLSFGSACHNALCSTNHATRAHMAAVRRLHTLCFIDAFVGEVLDIDVNNTNDDGKRYCALLYIKI